MLKLSTILEQYSGSITYLDDLISQLNTNKTDVFFGDIKLRGLKLNLAPR